MGYVPLWCKSNFSFLEGASHPEELVQRARELGIPALVLADRDGVYGIVRAHVAAGSAGPRLIVGAQVTVTDRPDDPDAGRHRPRSSCWCRTAPAMPTCAG